VSMTLVAYDVANDRRRLRLAKALKDFGRRVQYSVFECHLDPAQLDRLRGRLQRLVDEEHDSIRIYRLCGTCGGGVEILGQGVVTEDPEVYIL